MILKTAVSLYPFWSNDDQLARVFTGDVTTILDGIFNRKTKAFQFFPVDVYVSIFFNGAIGAPGRIYNREKNLDKAEYLLINSQ